MGGKMGARQKQHSRSFLSRVVVLHPSVDLAQRGDRVVMPQRCRCLLPISISAATPMQHGNVAVLKPTHRQLLNDSTVCMPGTGQVPGCADT
jgi:hypothetical protein